MPITHPTLRLRPILTIFVAAFLTPMLAHAESSKELAVRGKRTWSAFECSTLAELAGNRELHEKLFMLGVEEGRAFLKAFKEGKIDPEDVRSEVPMIVLLSLGGPSDDFRLGRIFESARQGISESIYRNDGTQSDEEVRILAQRELDRRNCALLLRQ